MTARRWIIGRGLLGNAIARARPDVPFQRRIRWSAAETAVADLRAAATEFLALPGPLEIYWCAGRAVTSSPQEVLDIEQAVFAAALDAIEEVGSSAADRVVFFLGSSAGGAYAGSLRPPFTESTPPVPASAYGRTKLAMEGLLRDAATKSGWRAVIARITNIYGPGQQLGKGQGLISTLINGSITGRPVSIYVPLDTLRDYIYEDDAGALVEAAMRRAHTLDRGETVVKVVGSGRAVSIGALLSELERLRRRRGAIVLGQGDATGQALDLRARTTVWTDLDHVVRTTLPEGLGKVFQASLSGLALHGVAR